MPFSKSNGQPSSHLSWAFDQAVNWCSIPAKKPSDKVLSWCPRPLNFGFSHCQKVSALPFQFCGRSKQWLWNTRASNLWEIWTLDCALESALLPDPSPHSITMLSAAFYKHGLFCTTHPWEVIAGILTLTSAMVSLTFFGDSTKSKICGWNFQCPKEEDIQSADIIILSVVHCLAAAYIYLQFRKMSALGSKYLLGLIGLLCILFSVSFSAGFVHLIGYELHGLSDSLPFFLLLLDLSKFTALAKYALAPSSQSDSVKETVARGVAILGPALTLDTLVQVLVIGIGCVSGVPLLELICCFGCVSLIVNYVIFMSFFPGSLCLIVELAKSNQPALFPKAKQYELESRPNPAEQRIKLIMSAGLALVHAYSRLSDDTADELELKSSLVSSQARQIIPTMPLWEFYLREMFSFSPQQIISFIFISGICIKYILFDSVKDNGSAPGSPIKTGSTVESRPGTESTVQPAPLTSPTVPECAAGSNAVRVRRFTVGDDDEVDFRESVMPCKLDQEVQTDEECDVKRQDLPTPGFKKILDNRVNMLKTQKNGLNSLTDAEILILIENKQISAHKLEEELGDLVRAVRIRRMLISAKLVNAEALTSLPYENYDYSFVSGTCCENVLGFMPVPVGEVGPLRLDKEDIYVPVATTEGCLTASINRGCRAITLSGGATSHCRDHGMTRAPVVTMPSASEAWDVMEWIEGDGYEIVRQAFDRTSRFARLKRIKTALAGRTLYIRFQGTTGDAMGMNMLCKASESALHAVQEQFPEMEIVALSGNYCTDKKPSALNWIEGRGKEASCSAVIKADVLRDVLKTSAAALSDLNVRKCLIGSSMAGCIGGSNAQAANVVAAVFLATGQDIAQSVVSSNCITLMEPTGPNLEDLRMMVNMPSLEVGTVGGGTNLPPQSACLKMLNIAGPSPRRPGAHAEKLARVICAAVLAGELSLMSALAAGHLVQSHLKHNRSKIDIVHLAPTAPTPRVAGSLKPTIMSLPLSGNI